MWVCSGFFSGLLVSTLVIVDLELDSDDLDILDGESDPALRFACEEPIAVF